MTAVARSMLAEAIGTFALVFAGCGAIMVDHQTHALGHVGVAISFGLVIMIMIYAVGHISGAHFNPAVTLAFAVSRHFPPARVLAYWAAQLAERSGRRSSCAARWATSRMWARRSRPAPTARRSCGRRCYSFFLMFVIMAVATDARAVGEAAAIAIGGTVGLDAMFGGPITGASMNPARSLGPAIAAGDFTSIWVYLAAPIAGAAVAAIAYQVVSRQEVSP